jgi:predicted secreted protein
MQSDHGRKVENRLFKLGVKRADETAAKREKMLTFGMPSSVTCTIYSHGDCGGEEQIRVRRRYIEEKRRRESLERSN